LRRVERRLKPFVAATRLLAARSSHDLARTRSAKHDRVCVRRTVDARRRGASHAACPPDAATVRFQLDLEPDQYARYTAVLKTAGGRTVYTRPGLASRRSGKVERVTLDIPAAKLAEEEYVLTLGAPGSGDVVADYLFRIERW
jgi:hypothetical protein